MTRLELIRQRRQMHRRIQQAVAERRLAVAMVNRDAAAAAPAEPEP